MEAPGRVVLVDVYAPSRRLAPKFREQGYECVRVQSTAQVPRVYRGGSWPAEDFVDNVVHGGDIEATADRLMRHRPVAVLAAGESGVELADALSERIGTPTNGTRMSAARRDKFLMIEALHQAGVPAARQMLVEDVDAVRAWHEKLGGTVVLKPTRSAASVGVTFCDTPEESASAYLKLRDAESVFSEPNSGVVAQEALVGTEYMVDTVSRDGVHVVADIWRTTRINVNGASDLVDGIYLMPSTGPVQETLVAYARRVLDALDIRYGMAHLEIRLTPSGPRLVEVGARMAGADLPHYASSAIGRSQLDWAVDAYLRPDEFRALADQPYQLRRFFATVPMLSPVEGRLRRYRPESIAAIRSMESFVQILEAVQPGGPLRRTVDDMTIPMAVNLQHEVEEVVLRDSRTLRYLDGAGFYECEPAA
ncbi:ATP-grasp domain-containing protein [Krasilnikovia cinnamomea]|uniref:ATP-grasp domain-containing protein n=1 Tax=Krasilnikovia cinnamomea TaxID=349313 RepID=A0A4Q7ZL22_9ACTN|nr:ATP-grasp domain-containing protein [Krasilnikovia cinnamomea]RZU51652.1 ATP-grasp domain-containing protein [Krasilnikovia cinnamomea]